MGKPGQQLSVGYFVMIGRWCACSQKGMGVRGSNEAEVLAILTALKTFFRSFQGSLIVEASILFQLDQGFGLPYSHGVSS